MEVVNNYCVDAISLNGVDTIRREFSARNLQEAIEQQIGLAEDYQEITISRKDMWGNWVTAAEIWQDGSYVFY